MHRHFQRDLVRARLATARALVKVLTDGEVRGGIASVCIVGGGHGDACVRAHLATARALVLTDGEVRAAAFSNFFRSSCWHNHIAAFSRTCGYALALTPTRRINTPHHTTQGAASHAVGASLSLSAAVEGLGPRFRLLVSITNEGAEAMGGLVVVLHYDGELYR